MSEATRESCPSVQPQLNTDSGSTDPYHYGATQAHANHMLPQDHCIELISCSPSGWSPGIAGCVIQSRQYTMCSGDSKYLACRLVDVFPLTRASNSHVDSVIRDLGRNYVDSDVAHTCREFESLQRRMIDKYDGSAAVRPVPSKLIHGPVVQRLQSTFFSHHLLPVLQPGRDLLCRWAEELLVHLHAKPLTKCMSVEAAAEVIHLCVLYTLELDA